MSDQHIGERPAFTGPVTDTTELPLAVGGSNTLERGTALQLKTYIGGGGGGGATNLAYTASATGGTVTSDTGTDATLPLADDTDAGLMAPAQHSKLAGIAAGATAVTVDATPTDGSGNAVSSNGVFDALAGKSDTGHNHSGVYDPAGTATNAVSNHAGAADPHGDRAWASGQFAVTGHNHSGTYDPAGTASSALSAHTGAADPHTQYVLESTVGAAGGVASLDGGGQVPAAQIPAIAITELLGTVASQSAMLALTGQKGDWCIRSDTGTTWIITGADPSLLAGWTELVYPAAPVSSVAGRAGAVTLTSSDLTDTTAAGRALLDDADAAAQRATLGLGDAATKNVGTAAGTVAAGDHTHSSYETSIADAKVKAVTVLLPVTNDEITLFRARAAMTITKLVAVGGGFTYTVRKAADRSATGTEVVTGGSTVTSTTTGDAVTSFNSASIAAGDYVWLKLTSVTGTPASFNLTMEYT